MRDENNREENADNQEPLNDNPSLSELGVHPTTEASSLKRHRKAPRRNGRGANHQPQAIAKNVETTDDTTTSTMPVNDDFTANDFGGEKTLTGKRIIRFMSVAKPFVILSAVLTIVAIVAIFTKGLNLGLDFTGGVSATVVYEKPVEQTQVQQALESNNFNDGVVQYLGNTQEILLRLPPQDKIDGLSATLDKALDLPDNNAKITNLDIVGSQVGGEIYLSSVGAMALALACMFIYVMVRFQAKLSAGAIIALFHDSIITIGIFALFGWPFDLTVLAAILSLIGYSINDTIVVFDRIRENFRRVRGISPTEIVDLSLTETLRRTFMTISTVLLVVLAMMFLGGPSLYWFSVALFIGLILGTFSSIYIASAIPLWLGMSRKDFVVQVKPEFVEEEVTFEDRNAPAK